MSLDTILTVIATGIILFSIFAIIISRKKKQASSTTSKENDGNEDENLRYSQNRKMVWSIMPLIYLVSIIIVFYSWPITGDPITGTGLALLFHFLASWRKVGEKELGVILFYGRPLYPVNQGPCYTPWLIFQLSKETRLKKQYEIPAEPEKIFRAARDQPEVLTEKMIADGFRPPIRITFAGIKEEARKTDEIKEGDTGPVPQKKDRVEENVAVDDPLQERVTAETPIVVWGRVTDYIRFLTVIGSMDEAKKQLEDAAVKVLSQHFPKITVADALRDKERYDAELLKALKETTSTWGFTIDDAAVKNILLGHELNTELQKIAEARAKKRREKLEGEGAGAKEEGTLNGRTAGLVKMKKDLGVSGHAVLAAETARGITSNPGQKTVIVGAAGVQELLGLVAASGETLKALKTPDSEPEGGAT